MLRNYFAGWENDAEIVDADLLAVLPFRLISYHTIKPRRKSKNRNASNKPDMAELFFRNHRHLRYKSLMMDSGAYSAWNSGAAINIEEYFKFCARHYEDIDYFVALDHIPEIPGDTVSAEFSATRSWNRYQDMVHHFEENSLDPINIIPVFHQFEKRKYLDRMLEAEIPYIGLSPTNEDAFENDKRPFLRKCFKQVAPNGIPLCKTHAFGLSSYELLGWKKNTTVVEFPFYSADSTSWAEQAKHMSIIVPKWGTTFTRGTDEGLEKIFHTKWDFSEIYSVDISGLMERPEYLFAKKANGKFKTPDYKRENVIEYVKDLGHILGTSIFRERIAGDTLLKNELELSDLANKAKQESEAKKKKRVNKEDENKYWTEEAIELGLIHSRQWRMWVNCITVNYWTDSLYDSYPWYLPEEPESCLSEEDQKKRAEASQKIKDRLKKRESE